MTCAFSCRAFHVLLWLKIPTSLNSGCSCHNFILFSLNLVLNIEWLCTKQKASFYQMRAQQPQRCHCAFSHNSVPGKSRNKASCGAVSVEEFWLRSVILFTKPLAQRRNDFKASQIGRKKSRLFTYCTFSNDSKTKHLKEVTLFLSYSRCQRFSSLNKKHN